MKTKNDLFTNPTFVKVYTWGFFVATVFYIVGGTRFFTEPIFLYPFSFWSLLLIVAWALYAGLVAKMNFEQKNIKVLQYMNWGGAIVIGVGIVRIAIALFDKVPTKPWLLVLGIGVFLFLTSVNKYKILKKENE